MNATTHRHVYVGLAEEDADVRATRDWISRLDTQQYARLLDLLRNGFGPPVYDLILLELGAPQGQASDHLFAMDLHGTAIDGHTCPRCPL